MKVKSAEEWSTSAESTKSKYLRSISWFYCATQLALIIVTPKLGLFNQPQITHLSHQFTPNHLSNPNFSINPNSPPK